MQSENDIFIRIDEKFYQSAYRQIVILGKIEFPVHDVEMFAHVIRNLPKDGAYRCAKNLYELMGKQTFKWPLHEKCLALCKAHNIYPCEYRFYTQQPQYPKTVLEGLDYLTVAEIKPLLKGKNLPISGKREILIKRLEMAVSFQELELSFLPKFTEKLDDYAKKHVRHQHNLLIDMIDHRALFLHRMQQVNTLVNNGLSKRKIEIEIMRHADEQKKLAKLLDGKGYSGIIEKNQIAGFLPIFPSGDFCIKTTKVK